MYFEVQKSPFPIDPGLEIASRERSADLFGADQLLPDPDQVANRLGYSTADWISVLRFLQTDPHVWACCQSRKAGTLSREWEIVEPERNAESRPLEVIERWAGTLDMYRIMSDILDAVFFGMAPIEIVWQTDGNLWLPAGVTGKPPEWFAFGYDGRLRFLSRHDQWQGETLPDHKFLLPCHGAGYFNPYGERVLSRCYWPITWKRAAQKFWAILTEKYGVPWVAGKVPPGTDDDVRDALIAKLQSMVQDAVVVLNDDEAIEFHQPVAAGRSGGGIFEELVRQCDYQISKAILGQTLSTDSGQGGGSYALGRVHGEVRQDLIEGDKRMVEKTMSTLLEWICRLNFPQASPPLFRLHREEDIRKERADRDRILGEALNRTNLSFSRTYFEKTYNLDPSWLEENPHPDKDENR